MKTRFVFYKAPIFAKKEYAYEKNSTIVLIAVSCCL